MYFKLDENKNAVPCSHMEWAEQQREDMRGSNTKHIAQETVDDKWVSTVWLGLNHNWFDIGPPLIFETMVFEHKDYGHQIYCERYSTWQQAEEGHKRAVKWVKNGSINTRKKINE